MNESKSSGVRRRAEPRVRLLAMSTAGPGLLLLVSSMVACSSPFDYPFPPGDGSHDYGGARNSGGANSAGTASNYGGASSGGSSSTGGASGQAGAGGNTCIQHRSISVEALIDGRDLLTIMPDELSWLHLNYVGPGMYPEQERPIFLSVSSAAGDQEISWCPRWTNGCNSCDGSCELLLLGPPGTEDAPIASLPLSAAEVFGDQSVLLPANLSNVAFTCTGFESQDTACTLIQSPSAENGDIAIIDFNDNLSGGPALYTATLTFDAPCDR